MKLNRKEVENLIRSGEIGTPKFVHAREVAALLESLGYNDGSAKELGYPSIFPFAEDLFARLQQDPEPDDAPADMRKRTSALAELSYAVRKFSLGLAYAIPWMALLTLEYLKPNALNVPPELGGALSLALIASLITTGGFIQMISRSGSFYYGLKEPFLARRTCMKLLNVGLTSSLLLGLLGMILGAYFHLFAAYYLLLAAINFVALSLLWMFCAVLSVQGIGWCILLVFLLSATICGFVKVLTGAGNTLLLTLWPVTAVLCALLSVLAGFHRAEIKSADARNSARPRFGVLSVSLVPFFLYGTFYFSFLFADRLAAGSAVPWVSGLSFGIDPAYKRGMDLVLLAFLITASLVEYLSDSYLKFWRRLAAELPHGSREELVARLGRRHWKTILVIFVMFVLVSFGAWFAFSRVNGGPLPARLLQTAALGGLGYLMLSIALLEIVILSSVNSTSFAMVAAAFGLAVNLVTGYGLSHFWGVQYAAVGLLAGSAVLLWTCNAAVRQILRRPDYHYSIS
ncbi:MAG: hypothetical protein WBQ89_12665 [Candidatus Acidiferrum sp.]